MRVVEDVKLVVLGRIVVTVAGFADAVGVVLLEMEKNLLGDGGCRRF